MRELILSLFLLWSSLSFGQDNYEFVGTIQLIDQSLITYKVAFSEYEDRLIKGISVSDFTGQHRTESNIEGEISKDRKFITFREVGNTSTKSDYPDSSFCYVHLKKAKLKLRNKKSIIQGHFYSYYPSGEMCVEGDIYLIGEDYYINKMEKMTKRAKALVGEKKVKSSILALEKTKENLSEIILKDNESINFNTSLTAITLQLIDDEYEDGDEVDIFVNGELFAKKIGVLAKPKYIKIPLNKDVTEVSIHALNEGRIPPNSAKIKLLEFKNDTPLMARLNKGSKVTMRFNKVK